MVGPLPPRLTAVTLGARDLPALRRFYRRLGWAEVPGSDDGWCAFLLGGVVLALYPAGLLAEEAGGGAGPPAGFTLACNVDDRDGVDAAWSAAVGAGATPLSEPRDRPWGGRSGYLADPEGNRWEVAWAPGLRLGPAGEVAAFGG